MKDGGNETHTSVELFFHFLCLFAMLGLEDVKDKFTLFSVIVFHFSNNSHVRMVCHQFGLCFSQFFVLFKVFINRIGLANQQSILFGLFLKNSVSQRTPCFSLFFILRMINRVVLILINKVSGKIQSLFFKNISHFSLFIQSLFSHYIKGFIFFFQNHATRTTRFGISLGRVNVCIRISSLLACHHHGPHRHDPSHQHHGIQLSFNFRMFFIVAPRISFFSSLCVLHASSCRVITFRHAACGCMVRCRTGFFFFALAVELTAIVDSEYHHWFCERKRVVQKPARITTEASFLFFGASGREHHFVRCT